MKIVNFNKEHSILNQFLAEIRDINIQGDSLRFRRNIERIGEIMAYEISRDLPYKQINIQTPLAMTQEIVPSVSFPYSCVSVQVPYQDLLFCTDCPFLHRNS